MLMIRQKSILLKLKYEKPDENLLAEALKSFRPSRMVCPACKAKGGHTPIRSYTRMMITVKNGKREEHVVSIPLYKCPSCGHSHAILPDVLIPYGSYSLRFILTVLKAYLERTCTVRTLCDKWQIAVSTLYDWIHLFASQYSAWRGILCQILWVTSKALQDTSDTAAFPSAFFSQFGFSFFQHLETATRSAPGEKCVGCTQTRRNDSGTDSYPPSVYSVHRSKNTTEEKQWQKRKL